MPAGVMSPFTVLEAGSVAPWAVSFGYVPTEKNVRIASRDSFDRLRTGSSQAANEPAGWGQAFSANGATTM